MFNYQSENYCNWDAIRLGMVMIVTNNCAAMDDGTITDKCANNMLILSCIYTDRKRTRTRKRRVSLILVITRYKKKTEVTPYNVVRICWVEQNIWTRAKNRDSINYVTYYSHRRHELRVNEPKKMCFHESHSEIPSSLSWDTRGKFRPAPSTFIKKTSDVLLVGVTYIL